MDTLLLQSPLQLSLHLKSLRKARKLTQSAIAKRLRITQSRYAQIERNPESIATARLLEVLAVLGADVVLKLRSDVAGAPTSAVAPAVVPVTKRTSKSPAKPASTSVKQGEDW